MYICHGVLFLNVARAKVTELLSLDVVENAYQDSGIPLW